MQGHNAPRLQENERMDINILKGVVSQDHVHLHVEYAPKYSMSEISKQLKGRTSRKLQTEFLALSKQYWGRRFRGRGLGSFSTGNITDEMVEKYIEGHRKSPKNGKDNFFLE